MDLSKSPSLRNGMQTKRAGATAGRKMRKFGLLASGRPHKESSTPTALQKQEAVFWVSWIC